MSEQIYCLSSVSVVLGGILLMNGCLLISPEIMLLGISFLSLGSYLTIQSIQEKED